MQCLYCGTPLAIMRILSDGCFCCDEHRILHEEDAKAPPLANVLPTPRLAPRPRSGFDRPAVCAPASAPPRPPLCSIDTGQPVRSASPDRTPGTALALARPRPVRAPSIRTLFRPVQPVRVLPRAERPTRAPLPLLDTGGSWPPDADKTPIEFHVEAARVATTRVSKVPVIPVESSAACLIPTLHFQPIAWQPPPPIPEQPQSLPGLDAGLSAPALVGLPSIDLSTQKLREVWHNAPGDLKLIAMVIPMILLLTLNAAGPRIYARPVAIKASAQPAFNGIISRQWQSLRKSIAERAGIDFVEDFRSGLDLWTSAAGGRWSYDNLGFVRPGGLSLFRPSLTLTDYELDFVGRIDEKGLGFVFRAADASNYQAVKLTQEIVNGVPDLRLVHYAVVNGREASRTEKPLAIALSNGAFFNVHLEARGSEFTLMVQDKIADFWSDGRLKAGGIGFFCGRGEVARVRRVEVSHQNDTLGRFCAYLASEPAESDNGS